MTNQNISKDLTRLAAIEQQEIEMIEKSLPSTFGRGVLHAKRQILSKIQRILEGYSEIAGEADGNA